MTVEKDTPEAKIGFRFTSPKGHTIFVYSTAADMDFTVFNDCVRGYGAPIMKDVNALNSYIDSEWQKQGGKNPTTTPKRV